VVSGEGVEGEHLVLGLLEQRRDFRQALLEMHDRFGEPVARLPAGGGVEDWPNDRAQQPVLIARACPRQSLRKCTVQRCQQAPRTLAIAAFRPACASLMVSCTPVSPRATRPRRKSVQTASVSASHTSSGGSRGGRSRGRHER
jgi:hypothetical protein